MSKFTTFANDTLDAAFNNGSTGSVVLGSTTYTLPFKVALTTAVCTASAPGAEVSGGSYAAQSMAATMATAASAGSKSNTTAYTFSSMPACTWPDVFTKDSNATPKNLNFRGGTSLAKTVNSGDTCLIAVGNLTATES